MRFHDPSATPRFKKPPNYFSRRTQYQLLMLVFTLMFVLVLMERARDPQMYAWMFGPQKDADNSQQQPDQQQLLEYYRVDLDRQRASQSGQSSVADKDSEEAAAADPEQQDWQAALADAWEYVVDQLSPDSLPRLAETFMQLRNRGALSHSLSDSLSDSLRSNLADAVDELDAGWQQYLTSAEESFAARAEGQSQDADEARKWQEILARLRTHWDEGVKSKLRQVVTGEVDELTENDVLDLQQQIDRRALALVEDNSFFQEAEIPAWFRLFERLSLPSHSPSGSQVTEVTYLQLHQQPATYRGKLVRISGSVVRGEWVPAQENALGIERYAVLWLKPNQANSPVQVYCLEVPGVFPKLANTRSGEPPTEMNIPVEITGYFFKRHAYQSDGGVDVIPLILAKGPWVTGIPVVPMIREPPALNAQMFVIAIAAAALITVFVLVTTRKRRRPQLPPRLDGVS